jgi:hypothetical protein
MPHGLAVIVYLYPGQYTITAVGAASGSSTTSSPKVCYLSPSLRKLRLKISKDEPYWC